MHSFTPPQTWPTLAGLFLASADQFPDRPCFTAFDEARRSLTYREVRERVAGLIQILDQAGVARGETVALTGANSPEWALAYLAIVARGAVVVPLDHQLKPEDAWKLLEAGDCVAWFADGAKAPYFLRQARSLKGQWGLDPDQANTVAAVAPSSAAWPSAGAPSDLAAILFTSGTTGTPKGVMLTHENLTSDCLLAQAYMPLFSTDVFYALLPIHHSYTMLAVFLEALSVGAEVVFARKLAITQVLKEMREAKVTMFLGVPMLFNKILEGILTGIGKRGPVVAGLVHGLMALSGFIKKFLGYNPGRRWFRPILEQASLASIRICISGGGPLAPSVFRQYNQLGVDFVQGYGLTETSPILTLNPVDRYKETSVGKILPQVEIKVLDPDETGQGELAVRGPMVMLGYYKNPEATAEVLGPDGWLRTGDVGRVDAEGYVAITGRCKSLIVTEGGKNVYPEEIEFAFQLHGEVEQVLVRGYVLDAARKTEGVEALVYPSQAWQGRPEAEVRPVIQKVIHTVNQGLLPYQRISRLTILKEPLEMTTKRTVRRNLAPGE